MHIVHLIARLNDGGPARVIASLAREMIARGHRVTVLAGRALHEVDATALVRSSGAVVEKVPGLGRQLSPWDDVRALMAIRRRLRSCRSSTTR